MTEETIFNEAVEIADLAARDAYLAAACGEDSKLRDALQALLEAHDSENLLDQSPFSGGLIGEVCGPATGASALPDQMGIIAQRYTLIRRLGIGGMGAVYLAEQIDPIRRSVALKLIRTGMDSEGVIARFEAERQVLAVMDHPSIAKIFDAGTLPGGQPFFVMEYVEGLPLTTFCDQRALTIPERLNLFMEVCRAAQHAHMKGVIHRDLKPGNILVTDVDGQPTPKIIDFGLAKAMFRGGRFNMTLEATLALAGTPLYMAPEQADIETTDIDTRADVYALGVVLYELLAGTTPIDRETCQKITFEELLRTIREVDPPMPSDRLRSGRSTDEIASSRGTTPDSLTRIVTGDLDWIAMKAISKDRSRRYESANDFARDVERYLRHEPVTACPPSNIYHVKKFVQRHRGPVIAASLVVLALVFGVIGTTWGLIKASAAENEEKKQRILAEEHGKAKEISEAKAIEEAARANKEALAAEQFSTFLVGIFESGDQLAFIPVNHDFLSTRSSSRSPEFLIRGVQRLLSDQALKEQPVVRARLLFEVANISLVLGQIETSRSLANQALELRRFHLAADHPDLVRNLRLVAQLECLDGDYGICIARHQELIALLEKSAEPDSLMMADTKASLACCLAVTQRKLAGELATHAYEINRARLGGKDFRTITTGWLMVVIKHNDSKFDFSRISSELVSDLGIASSVHPELASLMRKAFAVVAAAGKPNAVAVYKELVEELMKTLGERHFLTIRAKTRLAGLIHDTSGDQIPALEEAARLYEEIAVVGPKWDRANSWRILGRIYATLGRDADAEVNKLKAISEFGRQGDLISANVLPEERAILARMYLKSRSPEKLARIGHLLEDAWKDARTNPNTLPNVYRTALLDLAKFRIAQTPPTPCIELFEEAARLMKKQFGDSHLFYLEALAYYSAALRLAGRTPESDAANATITKILSKRPKVNPARRLERERIQMLLNGGIPDWQ